MRLLKEMLLGECKSGTVVLCDGVQYIVQRTKSSGYVEVKNKTPMLYSLDDLECCIPDGKLDVLYSYRPNLVVIVEV